MGRLETVKDVYLIDDDIKEYLKIFDQIMVSYSSPFYVSTSRKHTRPFLVVKSLRKKSPISYIQNLICEVEDDDLIFWVFYPNKIVTNASFVKSLKRTYHNNECLLVPGNTPNAWYPAYMAKKIKDFFDAPIEDYSQDDRWMLLKEYLRQNSNTISIHYDDMHYTKH